MREKLLNAVQEAVVEIGSTMLFIDITTGTGGGCETPIPAEISAIVGLSGGLNGSLRLAASKDAALKLASALAGEPITSLDATAQDGFAELANMSAGGLQTRLCSEMGEINLTPPVVVTGHEHRVSGERGELCARQAFNLEDTTFFAEVLYVIKK